MTPVFPPVLILAGGLGTRLGALASDKPKAMVDVAGQPFIAHQLQLLKEQGVTRVILCLAHLSQQIESFVKDGSQFGLTVNYSYDGPSKLGTGGAVLRASSLVQGHVAVLYGDTYLDVSYPPIYKAFKDSGCEGMMTVLHNNNQWDKSNILFSGRKVLEYNKEHPRPEMQHIDYGLSILNHRTIERYADRYNFDLSDVFKDLIERRQMAGYEVKRRFYEIGTKEGLAQTDEYLRKRLSGHSGSSSPS